MTALAYSIATYTVLYRTHVWRILYQKCHAVRLIGTCFYTFLTAYDLLVYIWIGTVREATHVPADRGAAPVLRGPCGDGAQRRDPQVVPLVSLLLRTARLWALMNAYEHCTLCAYEMQNWFSHWPLVRSFVLVHVHSLWCSIVSFSSNGSVRFCTCVVHTTHYCSTSDKHIPVPIPVARPLGIAPASPSFRLDYERVD